MKINLYKNKINNKMIIIRNWKLYQKSRKNKKNI